MLNQQYYEEIVRDFLNRNGIEKVLSIDLETLIRNQNDFLTDERIIAISLSYFNKGLETELLIANNDSQEEEDRILSQLDSFIASVKPGIIIGYNHAGYDIPLLRLKMRRRNYTRQLWSLKYYLAVSYCLDMMPVISDFLGNIDGDYKYRKLSEVVINQIFSHLNLDRKKDLVIRDDKNIGEVIEELWRTNSTDFVEYCRGDTRDLLAIFQDIFRK